MFEHCLYFNTTSLARQLEREWTRAFKPFGLTPAQAFMLRVIFEKQAITGTSLAQELNIAKATCSRTVDGLITMGLVERIQATDDGRSHELHPTFLAISMQNVLNQAGAQVTQRLKSIIGTDEFDATVRNLRGISASLI